MILSKLPTKSSPFKGISRIPVRYLLLVTLLLLVGRLSSSLCRAQETLIDKEKATQESRIPSLREALSPIRELLHREEKRSITFLQIGDSHTQGGPLAASVRSELQSIYGNGGRGWLTPLKLAHTNQPLDYSFSLHRGRCYTCVTSLKSNCTTIGPGGVVLTCPTNEEIVFDISLQGETFDRLLVTRSSQSPSLIPDGCPHTFFLGNSEKPWQMVSDTIDLPSSVSSIRLTSCLNKAPYRQQDLELGGVTLLKKASGICYHSIGINGATYALFDNQSFAQNISLLDPQVVLIALGTNEIISRASTETIISQIRSSIKILRRNMPNAVFILVSPPPIRPTTTVRTYKYRSRGKRRSKRKVIRKTYTNSPTPLRTALQTIAKEERLPVIDLFELMGGESGYIQRHQEGGYYTSDGIHFTIKGYREQGHLIAQTLLQALQENNL